MDGKTLQAAKELQSLVTEGPYEWAIIPDGPDQIAAVQKHFGFGDGDIHMIWLPAHPKSVVGSDIERPEHAVIFAVTGNGPNSERNAQWLHFLLNCADDLLADSERAERYRKALERIEREPCSESRHNCYDPMHIHCCSDMRVIAVEALKEPTHATER